MRMFWRVQRKLIVAAAAVLLASGSVALAQNGSDATGDDQTVDVSQPILAQRSTWIVDVLGAAAGLFLLAAVLGPVIRINIPPELPIIHSHDEPPGSAPKHH